MRSAPSRARVRHLDSPPGHAGTRCSRVRQQRPGSSVRRVVPVPVHHYRAGALSGFRLELIASGTTPKMLEKESQMRLIGYGGMMTESFVGIIALITAAILNQHLYFNVYYGGEDRQYRGTAAEYVNNLPLTGDPITPEQITKPPRTSARNPSSPAPAAHRPWRSACRKCCTACSAVRA